MKTIKFAFFFFLTFFGSRASAQLTIKSGNTNIVSKSESTKVDTISISVKNGLNTNSAGQSAKSALLHLFLLRSDLKILMNITCSPGKMPIEIMVERKSSAPLAEYRTVKTLSKEEMDKLVLEGKLLVEDNFTESRQLDSYYRLKYIFEDQSLKILPGVLLPKQNSGNSETYGDHVQDKEMFLTVADTTLITYDQFGLDFKAERNITKVDLTISKIADLKPETKLVIERKGTEPLATYRKIKELTNEEILLLIQNEVLMIEDKYPLSQKLTCFYRLSITPVGQETISLPGFELSGLRAK